MTIKALLDYKEYSGSEGTFHEKCNNGQGVLTGGVLLNLGVSREQLREMVNNRDKSIEITVKEPIIGNRSPDANVKCINILFKPFSENYNRQKEENNQKGKIAAKNTLGRYF